MARRHTRVLIGRTAVRLPIALLAAAVLGCGASRDSSPVRVAAVQAPVPGSDRYTATLQLNPNLRFEPTSAASHLTQSEAYQDALSATPMYIAIAQKYAPLVQFGLMTDTAFGQRGPNGVIPTYQHYPVWTVLWRGIPGSAGGFPELGPPGRPTVRPDLTQDVVIIVDDATGKMIYAAQGPPGGG